MEKYSTKPRKLLLEFLSAHPHEVFSVAQIVCALDHNEIGMSSIYRNLSQLLEAGIITKVTENGMREAYYRYSAAEDCHGKVHCHCIKCGEVFHMKEKEANLLSDYFLSEEGFLIETNSTLIRGICSECRV